MDSCRWSIDDFNLRSTSACFTIKVRRLHLFARGESESVRFTLAVADVSESMINLDNKIRIKICRKEKLVALARLVPHDKITDFFVLTPGLEQPTFSLICIDYLDVLRFQETIAVYCFAGSHHVK